MALSEKEMYDILNFQIHPDDLDDDLRRRLGEDLDDPNSELNRIIKQREERGRKMAAGDKSWMDWEGIMESYLEMHPPDIEIDDDT